jgi:probable F420-dependent oxidoreductase
MTSSREIVHSARARLGPVGVWLGVLGRSPIDEERRAARRIEELGYGSIWTPEGLGGREAFAHQSVLLAATQRIPTGTGIANVWARHPATMQGGAATLGAAYPGRFGLGIGVSHAPAVERSGQTYEKPLQYMVRYLDAMDAAAGTAPSTEVAVPTVLAALRPNMLTLARDRADGAHPYFVPVSHTRIAREALGPDKLLIPEQAVVVNADRDESRRIARDHMRGYLQLPNYVNNLKYLGYSEEDISAGGSDGLVDAIVAWGDAADVARRVRAHLEAGADHVLLQPLGDLDEALRQLESLAPAVLGN